jgi:hypothetical protein
MEADDPDKVETAKDKLNEKRHWVIRAGLKIWEGILVIIKAFGRAYRKVTDSISKTLKGLGVSLGITGGKKVNWKKAPAELRRQSEKIIEEEIKKSPIEISPLYMNRFVTDCFEGFKGTKEYNVIISSNYCPNALSEIQFKNLINFLKQSNLSDFGSIRDQFEEYNKRNLEHGVPTMDKDKNVIKENELEDILEKKISKAKAELDSHESNGSNIYRINEDIEEFEKNNEYMLKLIADTTHLHIDFLQLNYNIAKALAEEFQNHLDRLKNR